MEWVHIFYQYCFWSCNSSKGKWVAKSFRRHRSSVMQAFPPTKNILVPLYQWLTLYLQGELRYGSSLQPAAHLFSFSPPLQFWDTPPHTVTLLSLSWFCISCSLHYGSVSALRAQWKEAQEVHWTPSVEESKKWGRRSVRYRCARAVGSNVLFFVAS